MGGRCRQTTRAGLTVGPKGRALTGLQLHLIQGGSRCRAAANTGLQVHPIQVGSQYRVAAAPNKEWLPIQGGSRYRVAAAPNTGVAHLSPAMKSCEHEPTGADVCTRACRESSGQPALRAATAELEQLQNSTGMYSMETSDFMSEWRTTVRGKPASASFLALSLLYLHAASMSHT